MTHSDGRDEVLQRPTSGGEEVSGQNTLEKVK